MSTNSDNLDTAIAARIAEIKTISANPKPFYTFVGPDGMQRQLSATDYLRFLTDNVKALIELRQIVDEPFMIETRGYTRR